MHGPCGGTNRDGSPCSARARPGRPFCPWHDPELAEQRAEWRTKGGAGRSAHNRARKALPRDLQGLQATLYTAVEDLQKGELDPRQATALATLARAICTVAEYGDLAQRLAALEERLKTG